MAELPRRACGTLVATGALAIALAVSVASAPGCYSAGSGSNPPGNIFYFPVGLAVSQGGNVLYAVNSDFDLQWNGGTIQSYDLTQIRRDALLTIADPFNPTLPFVNPPPTGMVGACPNNPPVYLTNGSGLRQPLGETCAPPMDSTHYVRDSVIVGAFATDLQLSPSGTRLFAPVRGDATLTWADVVPDDPNIPPSPDATPATYPPFAIDCGLRVANRCDASHHAGNNPNEPGNTRNITMPGEPFGMAQSEDGTEIAITHQSTTEVSLFSTGLQNNAVVSNPFLQFVLEGVVQGGNGISVIPHDPDAFPGCAAGGTCAPRPAFLETSRNVAQLDVLRFYADEGAGTVSSLLRPFLAAESTFALTANNGGTDSRGIAIDKSPRLACKARAGTPEEVTQCAQKAAPVYFANRAPSSLVIGEIGERAADGSDAYDADRLLVFENVPLTAGPSRVYLAPIVDQDGRYAMRVFVVCFDSATIFVYDPSTQSIENAITQVGLGPYSLAFDPFSLDDVAQRKLVPPDPRATGAPLHKYRFAYVASFTDSFVQLIDLDNSLADKSTFENIVFTLGFPQAPVGTQ